MRTNIYLVLCGNCWYISYVGFYQLCGYIPLHVSCPWGACLAGSLSIILLLLHLPSSPPPPPPLLPPTPLDGEIGGVVVPDLELHEGRVVAGRVQADLLGGVCHRSTPGARRQLGVRCQIGESQSQFESQSKCESKIYSHSKCVGVIWCDSQSKCGSHLV